MDRWSATTFVLGSTGLFLIALSFSMPWYRLGNQTYSITSGVAQVDQFGNTVTTTGIVVPLLAIGVFLWWIFVVTAVLRPNLPRALIGWVSFSLVAFSIAHMMYFHHLMSGGLVGLIAAILLGDAAAADLNRSFFIERRKTAGGPFVADEDP